ncbi:MAG: DUF362 domain-containing protein [Candidatus Omnitrophota bacterium]|nr:DUF362 domain-containing protein [Candidatus Omnitrophota bacterium]
MKSEVYFIPLNSKDIQQRVLALEKLNDRLSPFLAYKKDELVPVKLTIGDSTCVYNISPQLVKVISAGIKKRAAKPFLFDTSVIYSGRRQNAFDHLTLAQDKGFGYVKVGAPFIIADGLLGQDGREYETGSPIIPKIKVPSFVGMLDSLVVLTHATGHIVSVYGGAIKNVAMGMSCRATKQLQHSSLKPSIIEKKCSSCGCCIAVCPVRAISYKPEGSGLASHSQSHNKNDKAFINQELCVGCAECICACNFDAVSINWKEDPRVFCRRMIDTAKTILSKFKNKIFITLALDITKECDCISTKDEKMISEDIGILASTDILSLDKAVVDLINQDHRRHFKDAGVYEDMFSYGSSQGLGNLEYNLIKV